MNAPSMNARAMITEESLNEKVMSLLRARGACADARSVMLERVEGASETCNWRIGHFDPGRGDRYQCKLALRAIHATLSSDYDMIGYS
jgi:hypothetical protein